jgi:predicted aldo/keto reductase-like oxidoreductase
MKKGFTNAQARLKAVWENPHIASICTEMPNMTLLMSNVAAALDNTTLSARDLKLLQHTARKTRSSYCAGCAAICESAIPGGVPIGDIMRYLMYSRSYVDLNRARTQFQKIPLHIRRKIKETDFEPAEKRCPRKMAIGRLMREALIELG